MSTAPVARQPPVTPMNRYERAYVAAGPYYHQEPRATPIPVLPRPTLQQIARAALQVSAIPRLQDQPNRIQDEGDSSPSEVGNEDEDESKVESSCPPVIMQVQRVDSAIGTEESGYGIQAEPLCSPPFSPITPPSNLPFTPRSHRDIPAPAHNWVRRKEFVEEVVAELTPCPGGVRCLKGAREGKREVKRKVRRGEKGFRGRLGRRGGD